MKFHKPVGIFQLLDIDPKQVSIDYLYTAAHQELVSSKAVRPGVALRRYKYGTRANICFSSKSVSVHRTKVMPKFHVYTQKLTNVLLFRKQNRHIWGVLFLRQNKLFGYLYDVA